MPANELRSTGHGVLLQRDGDQGAVSAEFAVMIPAVLLVLGVAIGGIHLAAQRVAITALAGDIARLEARGDSASAQESIAAFAGDPEIARHRVGEVWCVTVRASSARGLLGALSVSAQSCAALSLTEGERGP